MQVLDSNSERSVKGCQECLPLLLHTPNSPVTSSLTASHLWLPHSLLHYKIGRNSASRHHSFCPFQFIAGVPPTQAPSWQHLLPEDFGKSLGNLSRALHHSLEKGNGQRGLHHTTGRHLFYSAQESQMDQTVTTSCFPSFAAATQKVRGHKIFSLFLKTKLLFHKTYLTSLIQ